MDDAIGSGTQGLKYIAYPNAVAGASAMVSWLGSRGLLSYAIANDLDGYMSRLQATCYLGCVGLTSPAGVTTSTTDYSNYRAGISTWMSKLAKVTPTIPPGWASRGLTSDSLESAPSPEPWVSSLLPPRISSTATSNALVHPPEES